MPQYPAAGTLIDPNAVDLTGNQSIGGTKSFQTAPNVPANSFGEDRIANLVADLLALQRPLEGVPWLNVQDDRFGAKGDGVTDDRAAIQAAINAAGSNGVVLFPATGAYYSVDNTGTPLTITNPGVTLRLGRGAQIRAVATANHLLSITADDVTVRGGDWRGPGTVFYNTDPTTASIKALIYSSGARTVVVGAKVSSWYTAGVEFDGAQDGKITRCHFDGGTPARASSADTDFFAIFLRGSGGAIISHNSIINSVEGIFAGVAPLNTQVVLNLFRNNEDHAVYIDGGSQHVVGPNIVVHPQSGAVNTGAALVVRGPGSILSNIITCVAEGIDVRDATTNAVTGNVIIQTNNTNTFDGIILDRSETAGDILRCTVTANIVYAAGTKSRTGINVTSSGGAVSYCTIVGNIVVGFNGNSTSAGIACTTPAGFTGTANKIDDNVVYLCGSTAGGRGIYLTLAKNSSITDNTILNCAVRGIEVNFVTVTKIKDNQVIDEVTNMATGIWENNSLGTSNNNEIADNTVIGPAALNNRLLVTGPNTRLRHADQSTPVSVLNGGVGSIYTRTDGGAGTTLYVKESGGGTSAGWTAK